MNSDAFARARACKLIRVQGADSFPLPCEAQRDVADLRLLKVRKPRSPYDRANEHTSLAIHDKGTTPA
jgi:hypothetical protein